MPKIDEETLSQIRNELAEFTSVISRNLSIQKDVFKKAEALCERKAKQMKNDQELISSLKAYEEAGLEYYSKSDKKILEPDASPSEVDRQPENAY
jgi:hypothetical protein